MASASTAIPSSSFPLAPFGWNVFLSFRGEDTRNNFTRDLYAALEIKGIETFIDDEKLKPGEEMSDALKKAIKESRFAIIIFSRNYANSRWCLDELSLIMECREQHQIQRVFPVFLDGVDPMDVQHQRGSFGESFGDYKKRFDGLIVRRWRSALTAAALSESGWRLVDFGDEEKLIAKIVKEVSNVLSNQIPPPNAESGMKIFHNAKSVRLQSHHNKYLTADEDDKSVFQRANNASNNAVWIIELLKDPNRIRLKSCYGTYLTASNDAFLLGMTGGKVLQTLPQELDSSVEWEPIMEGSQVKLKTHIGSYLRANGGPPPWRNSITHDHDMLNPMCPAKCWYHWDVIIVP